MRVLVLVLGVAAVAAANLITTEVGPSASIYTAFFLIGFDLIARDVLHDLYDGWKRWATIGALIVAGSAVSYAINADALQIAKASCAAFAAAMVVDTLVYQAVRRRPWLERTNASNVVAAAVDSAVFVWVAFPGFLWAVAFGQFTAKVAGGMLFSLLLAHVALRERTA